RKAPHAVDRDGALLADLHANTGRRALLQGRIFPAQAFELSFHIVVGHCVPSVMVMDDRKSDRKSTPIGTRLVRGPVLEPPMYLPQVVALQPPDDADASCGYSPSRHNLTGAFP